MGIGDWGLGIGDWGLGPIPNPQFFYNDNINKKSLYKKNKNYYYLILINYLIYFII